MLYLYYFDNMDTPKLFWFSSIVVVVEYSEMDCDFEMKF